MKRVNKISELNSYLDKLIKNWNFNENGEIDAEGIMGNCLSNTVALYYISKCNSLPNKLKMVYGSFRSDKRSPWLYHYWLKIKIKEKWEILDITAYYLNTNLIFGQLQSYEYSENSGGCCFDIPFEEKIE